MKAFSIKSFKYGLDARRELLARQPGTLVVCENAHITQGGEVQKRKAFVRLGKIEASNDSFGLEVTKAGVTVFGGSDPSGLGLLAGVTYVRLTHPAVLEGIAYDQAYHQISTVKSSTSFGGKSVVAVTFTDGNTFLYSDDGVLVQQSRNGMVLRSLESLTNLANELGGQINSLPFWSALANVDQSGNALLGAVIVKSPPLVQFTPEVASSSTDGQLGVVTVDANNVGTIETRASAGFQVAGAAGTTYILTAPANRDGSGTVNLCGGTVVALATTTLTAVAIVAAVNDFTILHGYTAIKNATDSLYIYAPVGWGTSANGFLLTVTGTGNIHPGGGYGTSLAASISPWPIVFSKRNAGDNRQETLAGVASITPTGGTPPYTYLWGEAFPATGSGNGISVFYPTQSSATFAASITPQPGATYPISVNGGFKCVVTDASATVLTMYFNVSLRLT